MAEIMPESVNCGLGEMRNRNYVSALFIACFNELIPLEVIAVFVQKAHNPNPSHHVNGYSVSLLNDLESCDAMSLRRMDSIQQMVLAELERRQYLSPLNPSVCSN